jgi:hypothetical protein
LNQALSIVNFAMIDLYGAVKRQLLHRYGGDKRVVTRLRELSQNAIPIFIPCFNNATYCRSMHCQLSKLDKSIIFVDNNSTDDDMLSFLETQGVRSVRLNVNLGPRALIWYKRYFDALPACFCLSDPDLIFNSDMPHSFVEDLLALSERSQFGKVGLALRIDDADKMRETTLKILGASHNIIEWEKQYWVDRYPDNDITAPVYVASIDTTFALYNKKYIAARTGRGFFRALRVAGKYTARHDPWYKDRLISDLEADRYSRLQQFSTSLHKFDADRNARDF